MKRGVEKEVPNDDLVQFVKVGRDKVGQATDVPTPQGRNMAGWSPIQFKLQPEAVVMLDQLREHPFFRGVWKTQAQVAWSMVYLGLQATANFVDESWTGWRKYKSNFVVYNNAAMEHNRLVREDVLHKAAQMYRRTIHGWLDKDDAFGKYMVWKTLESALAARDVCEDVVKFDSTMCTPERGVAIGSPLVFDNRAGELYRRVVTVNGFNVDQTAMAAVYTELTADYFHMLDTERDQPSETEYF